MSKPSTPSFNSNLLLIQEHATGADFLKVLTQTQGNWAASQTHALGRGELGPAADAAARVEVCNTMLWQLGHEVQQRLEQAQAEQTRQSKRLRPGEDDQPTLA